MSQPNEEATRASRPTDETRTPLSFAQEQLWFLDQLSPGEITYNVPVAYRLRGTLDVGALHRALTSLVTRNTALRTTFRSAEGTPYGVVAPAGEVDLEIVDLADADLDATLRARSEAPSTWRPGRCTASRCCGCPPRTTSWCWSSTTSTPTAGRRP
ncbi:hypothetical protein SAV14893_024400 [Streptomyces avermitilis]|uniref:Condensation domain-containing protein n=1 Tax=Streptomyces avermitilis TaxID=33903 RepID=A0A4D4LXS0_STRAX|nr:condensation domain-containing protein [Streptomyces avermitilis]GDY63047.1 hypothetical protein SAV14893_024400 [Streptomyces avermitilis]